LRGRRLVRGLDRLSGLLDRVPLSDTARAVAEIVRDDLADDAALLDLLGITASSDEPRMPRMRPVLVALAARASGAATVDRELQHAAELLHRAVIVHDLALGRSGGRRRRVAKRLLRTSVEWLSGTQLTVRALELTRHSRAEVLTELIDTLREITDGHALTEELGARTSMPTPEEWREHTDTHAGAVYAFCCRAGGRLGDSDPAALTALGRYGRHLGRVLQGTEDNALFDGPSDDLVARLLTGSPVLPIALAAGEPDVGLLWSRIRHDPDPDLVRVFVDRVRRSPGPRRARARIAQESWAARLAVRALPPSKYRAAMEQLAAITVPAP
jgi:geranylgeranyl pyrophosphate synthase